MLKEMSKKGQGSQTIGFLVVIVVIVLAGILIAYWFYNTGGLIFDKANILAQDKELLAQTCDNAASSELVNAYCITQHEIRMGGEKIFASCRWAIEELGIIVENEENMKDRCTTGTWAEVAKRECANRKSTNPSFKPDKVIIDGKTCEEWLKKSDSSQPDNLKANSQISPKPSCAELANQKEYETGLLIPSEECVVGDDYSRVEVLSDDLIDSPETGKVCCAVDIIYG
jgi:hypothetical protein